MTTPRLRPATALLSIGLVVGCAADADRPGTSSPAMSSADVLGTWTWDGTSAVTTPSVTLRSGGEVEGHDGCNPMSGTWRLDAQRVVRLDALAATSYASCTQDGQQTAVQQLHDTRSLVLAGDRLEARDASGRTIATLTRADS
ncbi:META domain-containing protein [Aeromicrobium sp. IC_218]|uniref:META domain-containing protein n=1 Tax=Aeromicrobium sp. IC_218 TaxID=2545468 RepID=UPI00103CFBAE|nr:META domain-containing protein [Aeromicrobium sp. IC_218]TCI97393.1 META domain-containing protein [Aeromicrobium sp. IC_218]